MDGWMCCVYQWASRSCVTVCVCTWLCALSSWFSLWHCLRACLSASSAWAKWAFSRHFWEYCSDSTSISRWYEHSSSLKHNTKTTQRLKKHHQWETRRKQPANAATCSVGLVKCLILIIHPNLQPDQNEDWSCVIPSLLCYCSLTPPGVLLSSLFIRTQL